MHLGREGGQAWRNWEHAGDDIRDDDYDRSDEEIGRVGLRVSECGDIDVRALYVPRRRLFTF